MTSKVRHRSAKLKKPKSTSPPRHRVRAFMAAASLQELPFLGPTPSHGIVGGVIVASLDKQLLPRTQEQRRQSHVHHFRRQLANDVDAEQLPGLLVKEQLEKAIALADDLAAGMIGIRSPANYVGDLLLVECLLRLACHRAFRNGVNAVRQNLGDTWRVIQFEGITHC